MRVVGTTQADAGRARESTGVRALAKAADPRRLEDVAGRFGRAVLVAVADAAIGRALRALDVTLVVAVTDEAPVAIRFGPGGAELVEGPGDARGPVVVLRGAAGVLDDVFSGGRPLPVALGARDASAEGPVDRILRLCTRLDQVAVAYRRLTRSDIAAREDDGRIALGA